MSGLLTFLIIAIWIGTVIAKNNSGSSKKRTTYINGKPVEPPKKNNWNTERTGNTTYRSSTSYKGNSSYSSQAGSRNSTDTYRQMQELRNKVTKSLQEMRANAEAGNQKYRTAPPYYRSRSTYSPSAGYQRGSTSATKQDDDILSRAKQNVQENDQDLLKEADHLQHEAARGAADAPILTPSQQVAMQPGKPVGQQIGAKFDEDCDNRKKIQDLMIMGYSGNLEFERDFVAEGVDMLNRYQEFGSNL